MKALLSAFVTSLYLTIGVFTAMVCLVGINNEGTAIDVLRILFYVLAVLGCILGVANFMLGVVYLFKEKKCPYGTVMVCKLVLVPFFILNFIYIVIIFFGSLNPFLIFMLPLSIFLMVLTYGIVLATSAYNVGYMLNKIKNGEGTILDKLILIVCHFIFVLDVIASVVLVYRNKKRETVDI